MNTLAFVTHPSVRIKGSENNYSPSLCLDERCPIKAPHMHCPFCVKTDAYQDPVILKAHYRVKHVDKGIDFAGLKILRCCDHCDIVGIIKGEKRFKGAHWHCYRCRNGFNRRDEAIKHYKTHFRNPQTTFQIQITQDLNLPSGVKSDSNQHQQESINQQNFPISLENPLQEILHPVLPQTSLAESNVINANGSVISDTYKKVKIKEEPNILRGDNPVSLDQGQTIMIIQGDHFESAFTDQILSGREVSVLDKNNVDPSISWEIKYRMEEDEKNEYKAKMEEYKSQIEVLQQRIHDLESQQTTSQLRVQDLLASLSLGDESKQQLAHQISKYLEEIHTQELDMRENQETESQQHLIASGGIIDQLTNTSDGGTSGHQIATSARPSLVHQELQSNSAVLAQLGHMAEPYQVISSCKVNDNQTMSSSNNNSETNCIPQTIVNSDINSKKNDNSTITLSETSSEEAREVDGQLFEHVPASKSHNNQEIIVAQVVSPCEEHPNLISQKFLIDSRGISEAGINNVINMDANIENNQLLQVVASSSAQGNHEANTFIMETENGQQIIIQSHRTESAELEEDEMKLEPESKRQCVS